ncbi:hypothetical protein E4K72_07695 [Oxalobacteraceae bacterium OM1]|nr:hypothetical protein E4K72_07695 [Oxalobacteraceae bacterium OM1]
MRIRSRLPSLLAIALCAAAVSAPADAHGYYRGHGGRWHGGSRTHFGLFLGVPLAAPYYGPYPYYYRPPVVVYDYPAVVSTVPTSPPVYIEQQPQAAGPQSDGWWYYCRSRQAYYPNVPSCPEPFERVAPRPAG